MIDPTQPLHLTGSPTLTGDCSPQQTPLPACLPHCHPLSPKGWGSGTCRTVTSSIAPSRRAIRRVHKRITWPQGC